MFHIISLQRTASKALVSALHSRLKNQPEYLSIQGEPLAELIHNWPRTQYTFSPGLDRPFGHDDDVVYFRTHPKFRDPGNIQFNLTYDRDANFFKWTPDTAVRYADLDLGAYGLLKAHSYRPFVLKTQLASLLASHQSQSEADTFLLDLHKMHRQNSVYAIHLTRENPIEWAESMLVSEHTGMFIDSKSQRDAKTRLIENPMHVTFEQIERLNRLWLRHMALKSFCDISLTDTQLQSNFSVNGFDIEPPPRIPEFSTENYSDLIANHNQVCDWLYDLVW